jgi:hypothetical protein
MLANKPPPGNCLKEARPTRLFKALYLDFHFRDLLDNLLTSPDAFIHAGSNVMKTLWRSTPNG